MMLEAPMPTFLRQMISKRLPSRDSELDLAREDLLPDRGSEQVHAAHDEEEDPRVGGMLKVAQAVAGWIQDQFFLSWSSIPELMMTKSGRAAAIATQRWTLRVQRFVIRLK